MQNINRINGGKKAKKEGKGFETFMDIEAVRQGFVVVQIPDGCRQIGKDKLIRTKTPFDRVYVKSSKSIFCDLKSYDRVSISFSLASLFIDEIKLLNRIEKEGECAGFIIYFRPLNSVYFARASQLMALEGRSSLNAQDCLFLGDLHSINLQKIISLNSTGTV